MQSRIPNPNLCRYVVQSSDVISDLRVNVFLENSDKVIWYKTPTKERFLFDEEIIEHVVHNPTSTISWIIHRPKRGWYIRIRSPTFPPGVFIPLLPVPRSSPDFTDAALTFSCRTNAYALPLLMAEASRAKSSSDSGASSSTTIHSYPPSPPAAPINIAPPSPQSISAKLDEIGLVPTDNLKRAPQPTPTKITEFLLAPHSSAHVTGLLEIDRAEERMLGIDPSFWIAVALTYLEFLEERESYLAALSD
ncbi:hypothetical protein BU15DRAFT_74568 [Melanogaster broomeanus]|nr:hypothetical protein BU15DRAFT_74568 [Melanogaster broomeanus]